MGVFCYMSSLTKPDSNKNCLHHPPSLFSDRRTILINSVVKKKNNNGSDNSEQYLNILFRNGEI